MDDVTLPLDPHGLIAWSNAVSAGRRTELEQLYRIGRLTRPWPGVYLAPPDLGGLSRAEREAATYRLTVLAAARRMRTPIFTSFSATALLGLPIVGRWPTDAYVLSPTAHGSRRPGVVSVARRRDVETVEVDGLTMTTPEFSLIQLARHASPGAAVTAVDAALRVRRGDAPPPLTTPQRLWAEHERLLPYHRSRRVERVLERVTTFSDGPLESMSRLVIEELGFAEPELQVRFWLPTLGRAAYLDFYWRDQDIGGEADGYGKYRGDASSAEATAASVIDEKLREDALREQVSRLFRWDWQDMWQRTSLEAKLVRAGVPRTRPRRRLL